ncbi:MAG: hypothetical protein Q9196_001151 [Gyalolechia fulgens]
MQKQGQARMKNASPTRSNAHDAAASASKQQDDWAEFFLNQEDIGRRYRKAEIITGPFAKALIQQAGLMDANTHSQLTILDNACGSGAVADALHHLLDSSTQKRMKLTCGDFAEPMVQAVKERIEENGWVNTEARLVDAQKTGLPDAAFTHVLANFVIMGLQEPDAALAECFRILRPGGICAFTTWQQAAWIDEFRAAFATLPEPPPFPDDVAIYRSWGKGDWHSVDWIRSHLQQDSPFTDIRVEEVGNDLTWDSPAMVMDTFSVMVPAILKMYWSESDRREKGAMAVPTLLRYMDGKYGEGMEVKMHWVANVVTMRKPVESK